jgi:hypothetical protein
MLKRMVILAFCTLSSFSFATTGGDVFEKLAVTFNEKWRTAIGDSKKIDPKMLHPSHQITISFTFYQFDIPTFGLESVEYYEGKVHINYLNHTTLLIGLERKYNIPPHLWEFKLDAALGCLMSPIDKVPIEYQRTTKEFRDIRKMFWRGVDWTSTRKQSAFNIYQMHRNYIFLDPNLAYIVRQGGDTEALTMTGTIDSAVFTKIADSIRYRPNIQIHKYK